jgi:hypothetical protein
MIERLAIPAWQTAPTPLTAWVGAMESGLGPVDLDRDGKTIAWIDIPSRRVRGYAILESGNVTAINFELFAPDPAESLAALEATTAGLGWELHIDDDPDEDDDKD